MTGIFAFAVDHFSRASVFSESHMINGGVKPPRTMPSGLLKNLR